MNKFLVVFDTNVIVSALLADEEENNELKLMEYVNLGIITPIFSNEIMKEYKEVLSRKEFGFNKKSIGDMIARFKKRGILIKPHKLDLEFKDKSDLKLYAAENEARTFKGVKEDIKGYIDCYDDKKLKGTLFAGGLNDANEVKNHKDYLKKAYDMGNKIK